METKYDAEVDVLRIIWSDQEIEESDAVSPGVILDYDIQGNVTGIEVLNASKKIKHFPINTQTATKPVKIRLIDLTKENPTLTQIIRMADQEVIILKDSIGQTFVVSQIDDFESELQSLKNNPEALSKIL